MKPIIPKTPEVPELTKDDIAFLTEITFGPKKAIKNCDALFIFSGTHPGHWEKAISAYQNGYVNKIIVTGGRSLTGVPHKDWHYGNMTEAAVITHYLLEAGIPSNIIIAENNSTNTLENVLYAKTVFDFTTIHSLMFICKSHATGRQWRTLARHLPARIEFIPYTFDASYHNNILGRDTWSKTPEGQKRVWGEYLRILHYGKKGDILELSEELK